MTNAAVGIDIHQALDVHLNFAPEIALGDILAVAVWLRLIEDADNLVDLFGSQILGTKRRVDFRLLKNFFGGHAADAIDVGQGSVDAFIFWNVDSEDAGHNVLTLALFVTRIFANDADYTLAAHHFAFFAQSFY